MYVYSQFGTCCHFPACFSFSPSSVCYCYMPAIIMIKLFLFVYTIYICPPTNNQHKAIARSISKVNSAFIDTTRQRNDHTDGNIACKEKIRKIFKRYKHSHKTIELSKRRFREKMRLEHI
jgi:hypothetical protein